MQSKLQKASSELHTAVQPPPLLPSRACCCYSAARRGNTNSLPSHHSPMVLLDPTSSAKQHESPHPRVLSAGHGECRAVDLPGAAHRARVATATPAERVPSRNRTRAWRWVRTLPKSPVPSPPSILCHLVGGSLPFLCLCLVDRRCRPSRSSSRPCWTPHRQAQDRLSTPSWRLSQSRPEQVRRHSAQRYTDRVGRSR